MDYYQLYVDKQNELLIAKNMVYDKDILLPISLYGQNNTIDYGQEFQNNFLYLLQNFSSNTAMPHPTPGVLWYDTSITPPKLKLYTDDNVWKQVQIGGNSPGVVTVVSNTSKITTQSTLSASFVDPDGPISNIECNWYSTSAPTKSLANTSTFTPSKADYYYAEYTYNDAVSQIAKTSAKSAVVTVVAIADNIGIATLIGTGKVDQEISVTVDDIDVPDPATYSYDWYLDGTATAVDTTKVGKYIPKVPGTYYVIVYYRDSVNTQATVTSTSNKIKVDYADTPPGVGGFWKGGYYAGRIIDGTAFYDIIVAPKGKNSAGYVGETTQLTMFQTSISTPPVETVTNISGVKANANLKSSTYPAAFFCASIKGDYTDWYLPTIHELELLYYTFKPAGASSTNVTLPYTANYDVYPSHDVYTNTTPAKWANTKIPEFGLGGSQEFATSNFYLSCTTVGNNVIALSFNNGEQKEVPLTNTNKVRAIRRVYAGEVPGNLIIAPPVIDDVTAHVEFNSKVTGSGTNITNAIPLNVISGGSITDGESVIPLPVHGKVTYSKTSPFAYYEPAIGWTGDDTFGYRVKNGIGWSNVKTVTVTTNKEILNSTTKPPVIADIGGGAGNDTITSTIVLAPSITYPNGTITSVEVGPKQPAYGSVTVSFGNILYTPQIISGGAIDVFEYTVWNSNGQSNVAKVTVILEAKPVTTYTAPVIDNVIYTIKANAPAAFYPGKFVSTGDVTGIGYAVTVGAGGGVLSQITDGSWDAWGTSLSGDLNPGNYAYIGNTTWAVADSSTPVLNKNAGFIFAPATNWTGTVSFDYTAYNSTYTPSSDAIPTGALAATKKFTIIVQANTTNTGIPPVMDNMAVQVPAFVTGNSASEFKFTGAFNGTIFWYRKTLEPTKGVVSLLTATNSFTYLPNIGATGTDTFKFDAGNEFGDSIEKTVTVTILAAGTKVDTAVPEIGSVTGSVKYNSTSNNIALTITNAHGVIKSSSVGKVEPTLGTALFDGSTLTYTPKANTTGIDKFSYFVSNGNGDSNENQVAITIETQVVDGGTPPAAETPVVGNITQSVEYNSVDNVITIPLQAGKYDKLVWDPVNSPSNYKTLTISTPPTTFKFTPAASFSGAITFAYTVMDGSVSSAPAIITLTVEPQKLPTYLYSILVQQTINEMIALKDAPVPGMNFRGGKYINSLNMIAGHPAINTIYILLNERDRGTKSTSSYYGTSSTPSFPAKPYINTGAKLATQYNGVEFCGGYKDFNATAIDGDGLAKSICTAMRNESDLLLNEAKQTTTPITNFVYHDWYIPSIRELELLYYWLKPDATPNNTGTGANSFAIPARGNHTSTVPGVTSQLNYRSSGANAFKSTVSPTSIGTFWSTTTSHSGAAGVSTMNFSDGAIINVATPDKTAAEFCTIRYVPAQNLKFSGTKYAGSALTATINDISGFTDAVFTMWRASPVEQIDRNLDGVFYPLYAGKYYVAATYTDKYNNVRCAVDPAITILDAPIPSKYGLAWGGGVWAGDLNLIESTSPGVNVDVKWRLVLAPVAGGEFSVKEPSLTTINASNGLLGDANTANLLKSNRLAAQKVDDINSSGGINGYTDWYIPSNLELEMMYRHLKPITMNNSTTSGANIYAWDKTEQANYTATKPARTAIAGYYLTGPTDKAVNEALATYAADKITLGSSTWTANNSVIVRNMQNGSQSSLIVDTNTVIRYRLVRKVKAV